MAGARFDGTAAIEHLSGLVDAINDPSPLLAELGEYGLRSTRARFKTQTAPDGTAWAALQPWYQKDKRRNKNRILTLNGANSILVVAEIRFSTTFTSTTRGKHRSHYCSCKN